MHTHLLCHTKQNHSKRIYQTYFVYIILYDMIEKNERKSEKKNIIYMQVFRVVIFFFLSIFIRLGCPSVTPGDLQAALGPLFLTFIIPWLVYASIQPSMSREANPLICILPRWFQHTNQFFFLLFFLLFTRVIILSARKMREAYSVQAKKKWIKGNISLYIYYYYMIFHIYSGETEWVWYGVCTALWTRGSDNNNIHVVITLTRVARSNNVG